MPSPDPLRLAVALLACLVGLVMFAAAPTLAPAGAAATKEAAQSSPGKADQAGSPRSAAKPTEKQAAAKESKVKAAPIEPADNSYCLVCHLNYETEKLTRKHQVAGIGCAKCHGASEKHSGDEDGLTAPDMIYAHQDVNKFCMTCHPRETIAKNPNHEDVFPAKLAGPNGGGKPVSKAGPSKAEERLVCTECHGENHRMEVRTRKWDKTTRKLISDDGVRMMYKDSPATEGVKASKKKP